jgi:hypothetical protein
VSTRWALPRIGLVVAAALSAAGPTFGRSDRVAAAVPASTTRLTPPLYGVTIDDPSDLSALVEALAALPERPTTRVVFDVGRSAASYRWAVGRIHRVSDVMGELLDSSQERAVSVGRLRSRVRAYLQTLGLVVNIWEIGNEVNGDWTGSYRTVTAKLTDTYEQVSATGAATALTLYANDFGPHHCGDGAKELTPLEFSHRYIPRRVAVGLRYVLLSYYPAQCGHREPGPGRVTAVLRQLHAVFPHALLGFGEVGLPHAVTRSTLKNARRVLRWAYSLPIHLSYYVGGYFWWYAAEDALRPGAELGGAMHRAFQLEHTALNPGSTGSDLVRPNPARGPGARFAIARFGSA